nr:RNA polymerase sigma factor SigZ [Nitrospirota bacterium]
MWQQVYKGLRVFVVKRVANEAEADDILQEVFLRMHRKLDSLKDPQRLAAWVYQITRHAIVDHYRKADHRREIPVGLAGDLNETYQPAEPLPSGSSKDAGQVRAELAGCLKPMIARLSPRYREAITLVELEGLTQHEAAGRLKLTLPGMKSRVQRGRRQLKQMLEDCCVIQLDRRQGLVDYAPRDPQCDPCGPFRT